jgi:hypothetical protein
MNAEPMRRPYVVGIFEDHYKADAAVTELIAAGFTANEVGVAMRHEGRLAEDEIADAYGHAAVARTSAGAVTGAILGGALGAISSLLIPGLGPVLLTGVLLMAAGGGLAGGFAGLMSSMQLNEEEQRYFHHQLTAGRCVVFVKAGDRASEAVAILASHGAHDMSKCD